MHGGDGGPPPPRGPLAVAEGARRGWRSPLACRPAARRRGREEEGGAAPSRGGGLSGAGRHPARASPASRAEIWPREEGRGSGRRHGACRDDEARQPPLAYEDGWGGHWPCRARGRHGRAESEAPRARRCASLRPGALHQEGAGPCSAARPPPCSPCHRGRPCSPAEGAPWGARRCHGYGPELGPHAGPREGHPAAGLHRCRPCSSSRRPAMRPAQVAGDEAARGGRAKLCLRRRRGPRPSSARPAPGSCRQW
ncbi:hypothetical protein PVAP13_6KG311106 [Panicum virgatum]|uniref:Uncharacterized protein n=1 Tax=Panicum virgatum TaxID=38727 RepID=A0A8T0RHE4_PANVG|nr:hypothetical protein PVAP13_6KG311106 [Panicum virgatum]